MINEIFRPGQEGNIQQTVSHGSVLDLGSLTLSQLGLLSLDSMTLTLAAQGMSGTRLRNFTLVLPALFFPSTLLPPRGKKTILRNLLYSEHGCNHNSIATHLEKM